jgi:DNA-binding NarL/FixJ family response regulator
MTTLVLADDHHLVRQGVRTLLEAEGDLRIIGESADGLDTIRLVERLHPQVLVLDLMMPGLSGLEVARQVARRCPQTKVVILSMYDDEGYVLHALRNGALGYVLKGAMPDELIRAVRECAAGRHYLSSPLADRAVKAYHLSSPESAPDGYDRLTNRESEVVHLAAEGYSNSAIAARLGISPRTAETHRASVMRKLNLQTQADLVAFAIRRGLIPVKE